MCADVIKKAEEEVKKTKVYTTTLLNDNHNKKLVHIKGQTTNKVPLTHEFTGVTANDAFKLNVFVEVFQWREIKRETGRDANNTPIYSYEYVSEWSENDMNSANYQGDKMNANPSQWAFKSICVLAKNATIGDFVIPEGFAKSLGDCKSDPILFGDNGAAVIAKTTEELQKAGWSPFVYRVAKNGHSYFYSSLGKEKTEEEDHVGMLRVRFNQSPCGEATFIAQAIKDPLRNIFTFRPWNPKKTDAEFDDDV